MRKLGKIWRYTIVALFVFFLCFGARLFVPLYLVSKINAISDAATEEAVFCQLNCYRDLARIQLLPLPRITIIFYDCNNEQLWIDEKKVYDPHSIVSYLVYWDTFFGIRTEVVTLHDIRNLDCLFGI